MINKIEKKFTALFGDKGDFKTYFAPGRVNLIGEHTDYNGGHVFPCALTYGTYAVARKRADRMLRFFSINFEEYGIIETSIDRLDEKEEGDWTIYPKGMFWVIKKNGFRIENGMDILFYGDIPNASGLSSSASIEVLTGFICMDLFGLDLSMPELALLGQYSENHYNGMNCGIMDQFAVAMGKKNHAIFLNTADLTYEYAPIDLKSAKIIIINSNKKRSLLDSKYNERRAECEMALFELQKVVSIKTLGDLTEDAFEQYMNAIKNPIHRKRAKHAVYENQRTIKALAALKRNDLALFGKLMVASHVSLRDDYEVSGVELDTIVEAALKQEGVIGARMTGAGFGGCAVSIVESSCIPGFIDQVGKDYKAKIGYEAAFYIVEIGGGPVVL
jgi:galactokinase